MKKSIGLNDSLAAVVLMVYFAELVFPVINVFINSSMVCLFCLIAWACLIVTIDSSFFLKKENFLLIVIYIILIIIPFIFGYSVISHRYASMGLVLCGGLIYNYYSSNNKLSILKLVLTITGLLSLITLFITLFALLKNPHISRSIKSSGEYSTNLARQGIGGYSFIYYISSLSVCLLYYYLHQEKLYIKVLSMGLFIIAAFFIIKSNYMTAFLSLVVSCVVMVFLFIIIDKKKRVWYGLLVSFSIVLLPFFLQVVVGLISVLLPDRIARVFVDSTNSSIFQSIQTEFVNDRWPTMLNSITAFLSHPFLGLIGSGDLYFDGKYYIGFGQHSYILDTFALFGVLGGLLNIFSVLYPFRTNKTKLYFLIPIFISFIFVYVFNNTNDSIALVFTVIYPFTECIIEKNDYNATPIDSAGGHGDEKI